MLILCPFTRNPSPNKKKGNAFDTWQCIPNRSHGLECYHLVSQSRHPKKTLVTRGGHLHVVYRLWDWRLCTKRGGGETTATLGTCSKRTTVIRGTCTTNGILCSYQELRDHRLVAARSRWHKSGWCHKVVRGDVPWTFYTSLLGDTSGCKWWGGTQWIAPTRKWTVSLNYTTRNVAVCNTFFGRAFYSPIVLAFFSPNPPCRGIFYPCNVTT